MGPLVVVVLMAWSMLAVQSDRNLLAFPGTQVIPEEDVFPGSSPLVYAFTRKTTRRNLYKIPVH